MSGEETDAGDEEQDDEGRQNATFTQSQRAFLRDEHDAGGNERAVRQRVRERLSASVFDLGLALRGMERRDVAQAAESLTVEDVDEAIAFLELVRRHAGGGRERAQISVEYAGVEGEVERLESRIDRLEDGIRGLSRGLGVEEDEDA